MEREAQTTNYDHNRKLQDFSTFLRRRPRQKTRPCLALPREREIISTKPPTPLRAVLKYHSKRPCILLRFPDINPFKMMAAAQAAAEAAMKEASAREHDRGMSAQSRQADIAAESLHFMESVQSGDLNREQQMLQDLMSTSANVDETVANQRLLQLLAQQNQHAQLQAFPEIMTRPQEHYLTIANNGKEHEKGVGSNDGE